LVAEALRARGRALIAHPRLEFYVTDDALEEAQYELRRRVAVLVRRGQLDDAEAADLLNDALSVINDWIGIVSRDLFAEHMAAARRRIPRDPSDAPSVALALALECGIWTADRDFFGCGVAVWVTDTLLAHLQALERL
jgi:predicted nucleic acid-binding protein